MKLTVKPFYSDSKVHISTLYINGVFECFALEDPLTERKIKGESAIPRGVYQLGLRYSPKFSPKYNHQMIWVKNVPNYEYILIHPGNVVEDTEGCLIPGKTIGRLNGKFAVLESKTAYTALYGKVAKELSSGKLVTIEYL